jgi:outer membrane protein assembly factor BamB
VAAQTPTSDGERIFAMFSSGDLACLDLDGNLLWYRALLVDYPNAGNSLGLASSPIVSGTTLVVQIEADADAHALGLDVATGETRWHLDRPKAANWTSPVVISGAPDDGELVLLQSSKGVDAVLPATGEIAWSYKDGAGTIPSSAAADGLVFVPSNGLTALRPNKASETPEVVWRESTLGPGTPSAFAYEGNVYVVNGTGVLKSASAENGKLNWQLRLEGKFASTPVAAGGKLYFFNQEGLGQVVEPGEKKGTIVGEGKLGEEILCTPAIADGAIYVRSNSHLWKIAE